MKRDVAPTEDGMMAIRTVEGELRLLFTDQAEQVANKYSTSLVATSRLDRCLSSSTRRLPKPTTHRLRGCSRNAGWNGRKSGQRNTTAS